MGVSPLDVTRLGQRYELFVNTLNHPTNSCNAVGAGESAMMGREHFIETFGVPLYTMTTGGSGGAYTSLQLADAFPGLFDGVSVSATFVQYGLNALTSGAITMPQFLDMNEKVGGFDQDANYTGSLEGALPERRLRLVEARRQSSAGRDVGVVPTVAKESNRRRDG